LLEDRVNRRFVMKFKFRPTLPKALLIGIKWITVGAQTWRTRS
jgi:hypothetical protein